MAWDLSRVDTLPFPEREAADRGTAEQGTSDPGIDQEFRQPGPLEGISRNLAITGLGS
jgi:error-prone DNA polymerase